MLTTTLLLGGVGSVVYVVVNFLTNLKNAQHSAVVKQLIAWVVGALLTFAAGASQLAQKSPVFHNVGALGQALLGIAASSFFGVVYHGVQRLDASDPGSVVPPIVNRPTAAVAQPPVAPGG
jgi:hypothetical protein